MVNDKLADDSLQLGPVRFTNRLFTGTGKFAANAQIPSMQIGRAHV